MAGVSIPAVTDDAARLLAGIRDANYHDGGTRCLKLMRLEHRYLDELRAEVERLVEAEQGSDVTRSSHVTNWTRPRGQVTQYSIVNMSGRFDDFSTDHDLSTCGKRFHAGDRYPALARLVRALPDTVNVRINVLGPRARLGAHEEHSIVRTPAGRVGARVRFHLPLTTNPGAELMLDGAVHHLHAGVVYFVNHGCVHAARNRGGEPRIHVVTDSLLTPSAFERMFGDAAIDLPVRRYPRGERSPAPMRRTRMEAHVALAPAVSRADAAAVGLWAPP